uniref:C-type LECtin n=1 Tax=Parastrongyloides trichosuri TaxID=131310 RepID=A0A0N5A4Q4_PARTI
MENFTCLFVILFLSSYTSTFSTSLFIHDESGELASISGSKNCTPINKGAAYLDIVIILDSSNGTDYEGFNGQKGNVISLVSELTIGQGDSQVSRVAFITAATEATVISDLNAYNSNVEAIRAVMGLNYYNNTGKGIDIEKALTTAYKVIESSGRGPNFKKVILMYSSAMENDCTNVNSFAETDESPCRTASNIKNKGVTILTVALQYKDGVYNPPANGIASKCFAIKASDFLKRFVDLFTYINCFCFSEFTQFFDTNQCYKAAECLYLENTPTGYTVAQQIAALSNGTLVDIRSEMKQNFVMKFASGSLPVFIGLNQIKNHNVWLWDTGYTLSGYDHFYTNNANVTDKCALLDTNGYWYNTVCSPYLGAQAYIYQVNACDAGNFCA